ncbi:ATP-binding cassette domain-containing protein [Kitasatospora sp. NPDC006697]|uniref:ATP-binding cassette domain-containing protein n=1 Tax=Kitasatospora sp. NPDC006697 TaxID=3364020 RepID=UPI0036A5876A
MTKGLRKTFQSRQGRRTTTVEAVRGLDLRVDQGEIYGLLGPNGAGKTTTMRMLATLIRPDDGEATLAGADLRGEPAEVRRRIGYVSQGGGTTDHASAREELVMQARMYGIAKAEAVRRAEQLLTAFELTEFADRICRTYSGGQRRRVDLALGVIHRPRLLFLDEPTVGLDPQSRAGVWTEVRRLRDEGMTVVLTTHYLDEADALCDRIGIVDHGELVTEGSPDQLKREISGDVVSIELPEDEREPAVGVLAGLSCLHRLEPTEEGELRLYVDDGGAAVPQVLRELSEAGLEPRQIRLHRPSLDDVFLARTGRSLA